jgi:hypothetical protein
VLTMPVRYNCDLQDGALDEVTWVDENEAVSKEGIDDPGKSREYDAISGRANSTTC